MDPSTTTSSSLPLSPPLPSTRNINCASDASETKERVVYSPSRSFLFYAMSGVGGALAYSITYPRLPKDMTILIGAPGINRWRMAAEKGGVLGQIRERTKQTNIRYMRQGFYAFGIYECSKGFYGTLFGRDPAPNTPLNVFSAAIAQVFSSQSLIDQSKVIRETSSGVRLSGEQFARANSVFRERWAATTVRRMRNAIFVFPCYEIVINKMYGGYKPKVACNAIEQLTMTFAAGYMSGLVCALLTHHKDIQGGKIPDKDRFHKMVSKFSLRRIYAGFARRSLILGAFYGTQWTIYEGVKIITGTSVAPSVPSGSSSRPSGHSSRSPQMPESLRKILEESKLKRQKKNSDLSLEPHPYPQPTEFTSTSFTSL